MSVKEGQSGVAAVVLAAGMSRRMGTPKQLLRMGSETILERTLKNVRASKVSEIILVLGHAADAVQKTVAMQGLKVVINPDYQQGMGASLRSGLTAVSAGAAAALIVLADQPGVSSETLNHLIEGHQEHKPQVIIPMYQGFRGNPVLLDRSVFAEVQALKGDVGCRAIFGDHTESILKLPVDDPGILLDIDSRDDLDGLDAAGRSREFPIAVLESWEGFLPGTPELVLVGRDSLVQALTRFGQALNFVVTVVDPFLRLAELPHANRILHALDFSVLPASNERYCVVATRGQFDEEAVQQAILAGFSYIALVANKKRAQEVIRSLGTQSILAEKLATVRAPAGLEIGAESPQEIALSIMAEIVATRRQQEKRTS